MSSTPGPSKAANQMFLCCLSILVALELSAAAEECALSGYEPSKPRYLKFCQDYNSNACCIPGHDLENQLQFEFLIDGLGPGCKNPMMYPMIRYFYCLGCDPDQPLYTEDDPSGESDGIVRICSAFIKRLWDDYQQEFKECGVMQWNECPENMPDFDPYTCGDDLIIPPRVFERGIDFMNRFPPPGMYDYTFVERSDDCWQPPFMR
mmetsp:Transcript_7073/g.13864  ORF Transcript_7073/g.13864 Transcript_7073/m.13864 type:complete len:206 (-) Transcript_7073:625-1242(-)|eukprot:6189217-Pleurochrysis_carterae.AAC.3